MRYLSQGWNDTRLARHVSGLLGSASGHGYAMLLLVAGCGDSEDPPGSDPRTTEPSSRTGTSRDGTASVPRAAGASIGLPSFEGAIPDRWKVTDRTKLSVIAFSPGQFGNGLINVTDTSNPAGTNLDVAGSMTAWRSTTRAQARSRTAAGARRLSVSGC